MEKKLDIIVKMLERILIIMWAAKGYDVNEMLKELQEIGVCKK